ncbi:hypothetical protein HRbin11_01168 [bacterium HR11]|nr:hypothetical protein HRbin11_01168 [bacterium HR11]
MEARIVLSLCLECGACPEVRVYDDAVAIGEGETFVQLSREAWNLLVDKVLNGELSKL